MARFLTSKLFTNVLNKSQKFPQHNAILIEYKLSTSSKDTDLQSNRFLKIYTKTGDSGMTSTFTGERRAKDDNIFQALGAVDELASFLGLAREFGLESNHPYTDHLQRIQCILQDVNACIATPYSSAREAHLKKTESDSSHVGEVEEWIDSYTNHLPPLFICREEEKQVRHFMLHEQFVEEPKELIETLPV